MDIKILEIVGGILVAAGVVYYFVTKSKSATKTTTSVTTAATKTTPTSAGSVTTLIVPPGFILGANNILLEPVTAAQAFQACITASAALPAGSYENGISWNAVQYLLQMTPVNFANWCSMLLQVPAAIGGTASAGWLTGLSSQGQGFLLTLAAQGVNIPAADPRKS
jgi:hypothetical protein